jgi:hypothetical protein
MPPITHHHLKVAARDGVLRRRRPARERMVVGLFSPEEMKRHDGMGLGTHSSSLLPAFALIAQAPSSSESAPLGIVWLVVAAG